MDILEAGFLYEKGCRISKHEGNESRIFKNRYTRALYPGMSDVIQ